MATTRTLPVSGGVITKPALTDTADISVISTDMENIYQEFVSQNNNIETKLTVTNLGSIARSSENTYTASNNSRILFICIGVVENVCGAYFVSVSSTGTTTTKTLASAESITVTVLQSNKIKVTNSNTGASASTYAIIFSGNGISMDS